MLLCSIASPNFFLHQNSLDFSDGLIVVVAAVSLKDFHARWIVLYWCRQQPVHMDPLYTLLKVCVVQYCYGYFLILGPSKISDCITYTQALLSHREL